MIESKLALFCEKMSSTAEKLPGGVTYVIHDCDQPPVDCYRIDPSRSLLVICVHALVQGGCNACLDHRRQNVDRQITYDNVFHTAKSRQTNEPQLRSVDKKRRYLIHQLYHHTCAKQRVLPVLGDVLNAPSQSHSHEHLVGAVVCTRSRYQSALERRQRLQSLQKASPRSKVGASTTTTAHAVATSICASRRPRNGRGLCI